MSLFKNCVKTQFLAPVMLGCFGLYALRHDVKRCVIYKYRSIVSKVIDYGRVPPKLNSHYLRSEFRDCPLPYINLVNDGHSHPASAAWRSSTLTLARSFCTKIGMEVYSYQASTADVRDGVPYVRNHYWMKDVCVPHKVDIVSKNHVIVLTDVDYYVDMPQLLLDYDNPVLLYTFAPSSVADVEGEFSFRFDSNNEVCYNVCGGACHKHRVWDYGKDVITVSSWSKTKSYIVERRKANKHHEYVLFVPLGTWNYCFSWAARVLNSDVLSYVKVNFDGFNILDVKTGIGITRSLAKVGDYNCANLSITTFNALASVSKTTKIALGNATVQSWIDNDRAAAAVLVEYFKTVTTPTPAFVYPAVEGVRNYQIIQKVTEVDESGGMMYGFMSPIYPNTFVPTKSKTNEVAAIAGRIIQPSLEANKLAGREMTKLLLTEMETFTALLIPVKNKGLPVDVADVYERQHRPIQRNLLNQSDSNLPLRECRTFLKAEPYQKVSDPRIITTYNTVDKREYSRYTYALADFLKENDWYSFSKTPIEIATNVSRVCQDSKFGVCCADASRMDGHVHSHVRVLERMILMRYFNEEFSPKIIDLHSAQYNCRARTFQGVKYDIDSQRGSGSPETALFNTILSKFIDYLARRLEGSLPSEAYNKFGQFAGDDSVTSEYSDVGMGGSSLVKAGAMVGQVIETVEFLKGCEGVNYLSRYYTDTVWNGDLTSICDLPRALGKLHVTHGVRVSPLIKLQQKLSGLARTDRNTPVIREILDAAVRVGINLHVFEAPNSLAGWWAWYDLDVNWPNAFSGDALHVVTSYLPGADCAQLFDYLSRVVVADDLLVMPVIQIKDNLPPNSKIPLFVVDDEIVVNSEPVKSSLNIKPKPCYDYINKGKCSRGATCKFVHARDRKSVV